MATRSCTMQRRVLRVLFVPFIGIHTSTKLYKDDSKVPLSGGFTQAEVSGFLERSTFFKQAIQVDIQT